MEQHERPEEKPELNEGRRKLLKAAAIAGGAAVAAGTLPADWKKPLATVGGLPAHAQTSDEITISSLIVFRRTSGTAPGGDAALANGDKPLMGKFSYVDPLCDIDDNASFWVEVGINCSTFTKSLGDLDVLQTGDKCLGLVQFPFLSCEWNGSLAVQLSKGPRHSKFLNTSFDFWPLPQS